MIVTGVPATPLSLNVAPAASSCGVKDRSAPKSRPAAAGSGPYVRNSPTHTSAPVSLYTVISAYRAWVPRGSGMYIGLPGSSATLLAAGTVCQSPDVAAVLMVALADGLDESSVMPRSLSERTWPRSTVSVPVHAEVHQSVPASPSMAFDAGSPDSVESALAVPDSAQFTVGAAPPGGPSPAACTRAAELVSSGTSSTAGSAVMASRRLNPCRAALVRYRKSLCRGASCMVISVLLAAAARLEPVAPARTERDRT